MAARRQNELRLTTVQRWAQLAVLCTPLALTTIACDRCDSTGTAGARPGGSVPPAGSAAPTLFDSGFAFACSRDQEVSCSGVLPARTEADERDGGGAA